MIPHVAPPVWPSPIRPGRVASTVVQNSPELADDKAAQQQLRKCGVAILGIPDDTGVELNFGRPGAKGGPAAFRAALSKYGAASPADSTRGPRAVSDTPAYPRIFDAGDVTLGADIHDTHDRVTEATLAILEMGLFPIAIGGGHDLTFPFVRAVSRAFGVLDGVYIDAHLDVRHETGSGMPFRALIEGGFAAEVTCIGMNPLVNTRDHAEYLCSKGGRIILGGETAAARIAAESAGGNGAQGRAFVSLDLDAIDASAAPGVSAVNPCGLMPGEVATLVRSAGRNPAVKCFDIMELNPAFDQDGRTARVAAHLFLEFLRGYASREAVR